MKKMYALVRASFLEGLVIRNRIPIMVFEQLLTISVNYYIWKHVTLNHLLSGYDLLQLSTYPVIVWIIQLFIHSGVFLKIMDQYRTGNLVIQLTRPVSYFSILFCSSFGKSLFKFIFGCIPTLIMVIMVIKIYIPHHAVTFFMFGISILLSAVLLAQMDYCLGRMIFITENGNGLFMFRCLLVDIFSGILFPIEYAPHFLKGIIKILPLRFLYYFPASIYLEIYSIEESAVVLFQQLGWIVIGIWMIKFVTKLTDTHLQVQGG